MLHDSLTDSLDIEVEDIRCENIAEKDVGDEEIGAEDLEIFISMPLKNDHNGASNLSTTSDSSYTSAISFAMFNSSHRVYADAGPVSFPSLQNPELHHKTIHSTFDDPSLDCGTNHDGQYSQTRTDIRRENDWRTVASSCQRSTSHRARQVCRHF
ncbi:hypothetical protein DKX38_000108 [Salix brachista]|uniref:Uncharacterized protein n=1 Tax=Salix brachista TaxID=2182728 RepID=A0A5N5NZV9_9ROSI|nr:hypothetical protein DKX38_000108 [Salix brachista]